MAESARQPNPQLWLRPQAALRNIKGAMREARNPGGHRQCHILGLCKAAGGGRPGARHAEKPAGTLVFSSRDVDKTGTPRGS